MFLYANMTLFPPLWAVGVRWGGVVTFTGPFIWVFHVSFHLLVLVTPPLWNLFLTIKEPSFQTSARTGWKDETRVWIHKINLWFTSKTTISSKQVQVSVQMTMLVMFRASSCLDDTDDSDQQEHQSIRIFQSEPNKQKQGNLIKFDPTSFISKGKLYHLNISSWVIIIIIISKLLCFFFFVVFLLWISCKLSSL